MGCPGSPIARIAELGRHKVIATAFARELWSWNTALPIGLIPFQTAYAAGASFLAGWRPRMLAAGAPLLCMLAGFYASYVVTPFDLNWHLATSLSRLIVQIWPGIVFVCFIIPESVVSNVRSGTSTARSL